MKNNSLITLPLILLALILHSKQNFIINVSQTSTLVNQASIITISIKTSTATSVLDIVLSNAFGINNPACTVNATTTSCNKIVPTGSNLLVRFSFSFAANTTYVLKFNLTNPPYSTNFSVQATSGSTSFLNTVYIQVNPTSINCSIQSSSNVVSQLSNTTINLGVSTLAAGTLGNIVISVNAQTIFPNIINTSPTCMSQGNQFNCTLSNAFEVQELTISSINVGVRLNNTRLPVTVNSMRNPPYNATFQTLTIKVQNSQAKDVQSCTVTQPAPTVLQESSSFIIQGWNSLVGQTSNAQFLITPMFTPLQGITILIVCENSLTITPRAPATSTVTTMSSLNYIQIYNATYSSQVLSFNATVVNPSEIIPLSAISYILYNSTLFRQQKSLASGFLSLQMQTAQVTANVLNAVTLVQSVLNVTLTTPIIVNSGFIITIQPTYGSIKCTNLSLLSNFILTTITTTSCAQKKLILRSTNSLAATQTFWFAFGYTTHSSTLSNSVKCTITSLNSNQIMAGITNIPLSVSRPIYTAVSSNSTYTGYSNFTFIQTNVTALDSTILRKVTIYPPLYVKINDNSTIVNISNASQVSNVYIDLAGNTASAIVSGKIEIMLRFVSNPSHYLGGRQWNITCADINGYSSSSSTVIHTPQYSPATSSISVSLSNSTIQQSSNITLTYQPVLQYDLSNAPTLVTQFSASAVNRIVNSSCPNCVLLTSTKFTMPYYSVVMRPIVQIINNNNPNNNSVQFSILINGFVYEVGSVSYQLSPLQYQFVARFSGEYNNLGQLEIIVTTVLSTQVTLNYTGTQSIFSSDQQCLNCNSTYLLITGIVNYFQTKDITIQGYANGVLYAQGVVRISYTCSSITGCQICQTVNSTLTCLRCFPKQLSNSYLLYDGICYSVCPAMTYQDGAVCSSCQNLCYRCNSTTCLECIPSYYVYEGSCVLQCPPLYIKNSTHCLPRPVICPTNCIDCPADNQCKKCDAEYYLLQNLCYSKCPTNYIQNEQLFVCKLFLPPQQTKYFPFAFFIASVILFVLLLIIKKFQRRSLVIGNLLAAVSFLEIGAIIMMISYTFISITKQPDRWSSTNKLLMQGLIFLILVCKVALNLIFLAYFLKKVSKDDNFEKWVQKSPQNNKLYIVLLTLSTIFSFQIMRIIYCRFLGLQIFFGRFNTSLIFKPMNFFSFGYVIPGAGLIVMAIFNIRMQGIYRTSIYYSSIEVIMMQIILFACSFFQVFRSDKEYFDYQLYKVQNQSENENNNASKIKIMQQEQSGGSFNQMLMAKVGSSQQKPIGLDPDLVEQKSGKIIRNKFWRQKKQKNKPLNQLPISTSQQQIIQQLNDDQQIENDKKCDSLVSNYEGNSEHLKLSSMLGSYDNANHNNKSIFRRKILQDWEKIKSKIPKVSTHKTIKSRLQFSSSISPSKKRQLKNKSQINKVSSLQKNEKIKNDPPIPSFKMKKQLKTYFYKINKQQTQKSKQIKNDEEANQNQKQKQSISNNSDKITLQINNQNTQHQNLQNFGEFDNKDSKAFEEDLYEKQGQDISEIPNNQNEQSFEKSLIQLRKDMKVNRYDDFQNQIILEDEQQKDEFGKQSSNANNMKSHDSFNAVKKKIKKRNVNKQTEAVYLQRLVSSSEMHRPTKAVRRQKLEDF